MAKEQMYSRKFNRMWRQIKTSDDPAQAIDHFLNYSGKTVAIRGDRDQQKVVFTIRNRFKNSQYKKITKQNAWRVYSIVNKQQENFRIEKMRIKRLLAYLEEQAKPKPSVVIKKNRVRRIITNGKHTNDT